MKLSAPVATFSLTWLHVLLFSLFVIALAVAFNTYYIMTQPPKPAESDLVHLAPRTNLQVQARVISLPTTVNSITRFTVEVDSVTDQLATGKTQVSLRGLISLKRGDQITIIGDIRSIRPTDTFLRERHIFSQLFASRITRGNAVLFQQPES